MTSFQKYLQFLRTQFPPGSRVLLLSGDQPNGLPTGSMGTLTKVDSAGRFLVDWDTGSIPPSTWRTTNSVSSNRNLWS